MPHGAEFERLRCMPDQMHCSVKDVRTSDDAQLTVQLLLFYELRDIERMLDTPNDTRSTRSSTPPAPTW